MSSSPMQQQSSSSSRSTRRFSLPRLRIPAKKLHFSALAAEPGISEKFPLSYFIKAKGVWENAPEEDAPRIGFEIETGPTLKTERSMLVTNLQPEHKTDAFLLGLKKTPLAKRTGFHPTAEPSLYAKDLRGRMARQSFKMEYVSDPFSVTSEIPNLQNSLLQIGAMSKDHRLIEKKAYDVKFVYDSELAHRLSFGELHFQHVPKNFNLTFQVTVGVNTKKLLADDSGTRAMAVGCFTDRRTGKGERICKLLSAAVAAERVLQEAFSSIRTNLYHPFGLRLSIFLYLVQLDCFSYHENIGLEKDWLPMNFKGGSSLRACGMREPDFFFYNLDDYTGSEIAEEAEKAVRAAITECVGQPMILLANRFHLSLVGLPGMNFDTLYEHGRGISNFTYKNALYTVVEARKSISSLARAVESIAQGGSTKALLDLLCVIQ